jgi:hypothetical protein
MNKPKPVPVSDFVANLVNNLESISGSMPVPVSLTLITTRMSFFSAVVIMIPSSFVNLMALLKIRNHLVKPSPIGLYEDIIFGYQF